MAMRSIMISSYGTEAVAISNNGRYLTAGSAFNLSFWELISNRANLLIGQKTAGK